jgi:hypothetical protein
MTTYRRSPVTLYTYLVSGVHAIQYFLIFPIATLSFVYYVFFQYATVSIRRILVSIRSVCAGLVLFVNPE